MGVELKGVSIGAADGAVVVELEDEAGLRGAGDAADDAAGAPVDLGRFGRVEVELRARLQGALDDGLDSDSRLAGLAQPLARAAEVALLGLLAARRAASLAALLGASAARRVALHARVRKAVDAVAALKAGASRLEVVAREAESLASLDYQLARLRARIGPEPGLVLDAAGAWSADEAARALEKLAPHGVSFVVDPGGPMAGREGGPRVLLRDPGPVLLHGVDGVVVRPAAEGLLAARRRALAARASGLVVLVDAAGPKRSRAAALALAAALGDGCVGASVGEVAALGA